MPENSWDSIDDCPLYVWVKCNDGEFHFIRKDAKKKRWRRISHRAKFERLYDQYLNRFGLEKKFEKYLELMRKRAILQCDRVITGDRFLDNRIEILDAKIEELNMNFGDGQSMEASLIHLSKWLGYKIDIKTTTVVEYFEIVREYGKTNKTIGDRSGGSVQRDPRLRR
jgi:hypothetical protein